MTLINLTQMKSGQSGEVVEIQGGFGITRKLESMGIRIEKKIVKVSGLFLRGPVTVKVGNTQLSMGHGMAAKIIVEVHE